jgi:hypothetical protein
MLALQRVIPSKPQYKKDFTVLSFGEHYSLVRSKDVVGKTTIDISTVPRYVCYEELNDAIRQCHIDQEGHSLELGKWKMLQRGIMMMFLE